MIRACLFRSDQPPTEIEVDDWPRVRDDDSSTLWVDVEAPDEAELTRIAGLFGLHPRALRLIGLPDRQATTRFFDSHYLLSVVSIDVDESRERPHTRLADLGLVVGRNFLLSLHLQPLPFARDLDERIGSNPVIGRFASSYLLHAVLDTLVGHYAREVEEIEDRAQRLEEQLLRDPGRDALNQALILKRHIQRVRRLIAPHREAFGALIGADSPIDEPQLEQYFRDLQGRLTGVIDRLDHLRDIVIGSFNLYISNISYRTNQQLRVLTFLSAVLLPITAISGLFGTNFQLAEYDRTAPFYVMLAGIGVIVVGMLTFFRRRGWL